MSKLINYGPLWKMDANQMMRTDAYKEGEKKKKEGGDACPRYGQFSNGWCLYMAGYHDTKAV
jgi:hypothetical protein